MIQATVAIYPLKQVGYEAVHRAIEALQSTAGITVEVQAMHTEVAGSPEAVFRALQAAYEAAAASGFTVMTVTLSNACPVKSASAS